MSTYETQTRKIKIQNEIDDITEEVDCMIYVDVTNHISFFRVDDIF